jgi:hypothetical protein
MSRSTCLGSLALALLSCNGPSHAPKVEQLTLGPPSGRVAGDFQRVMVRELSDGRVLFVDGEIKVLNFQTGAVQVIGRRGNGPLEHPNFAPWLYAIGGDSSVMPVPEKWVVMNGGQIVTSWTPQNAPFFKYPFQFVQGADTSGHFITQISKSESTYVVRVSRATGKADTLDALHFSLQVQEANATFPRWPQAYDMTVMTPDGWIAVARYDRYRVDWWSPSSGWVRGQVLPFTPVKLDQAERNRYVEAMVKRRGEGIRTSGIFKYWADAYPAFDPTNQSVLPTPAGNVVIHRYPTTLDTVSTFDIVDRRGQLTAQVLLKVNERIVGFGKGAVYVVEEDEDGQTWLRRHPWPLGR